MTAESQRVIRLRLERDIIADLRRNSRRTAPLPAGPGAGAEHRTADRHQNRRHRVAAAADRIRCVSQLKLVEERRRQLREELDRRGLLCRSIRAGYARQLEQIFCGSLERGHAHAIEIRAYNETASDLRERDINTRERRDIGIWQHDATAVARVESPRMQERGESVHAVGRYRQRHGRIVALPDIRAARGRGGTLNLWCEEEA